MVIWVVGWFYGTFMYIFNVVVVDVDGLYRSLYRCICISGSYGPTARCLGCNFESVCTLWGVAIASGRESMRCRRWGLDVSHKTQKTRMVGCILDDGKWIFGNSWCIFHIFMIFEGWLHGKWITHSMNEVVVPTEHGGCVFFVFCLPS